MEIIRRGKHLLQVRDSVNLYTIHYRDLQFRNALDIYREWQAEHSRIVEEANRLINR